MQRFKPVRLLENAEGGDWQSETKVSVLEIVPSGERRKLTTRPVCMGWVDARTWARQGCELLVGQWWPMQV